MNEIIVILILVCGQPDTLIIKEPLKQAKYTHNVHSEKVLLKLKELLNTGPTVITYEDKRGTCA